MAFVLYVTISIQNLNKAYWDCEMQFYFSIIGMPNKSHFTIFAIQNFVQNMKNTCEFHLYYWDHVFKVNELYLVDCFRHEFRVPTQIMVHNC